MSHVQVSFGAMLGASAAVGVIFFAASLLIAAAYEVYRVFTEQTQKHPTLAYLKVSALNGVVGIGCAVFFFLIGGAWP